MTAEETSLMEFEGVGYKPCKHRFSLITVILNHVHLDGPEGDLIIYCPACRRDVYLRELKNDK
jgi:hypothetical protein